MIWEVIEVTWLIQVHFKVEAKFGNDALLEWVYRLESILDWIFSKSREFVLRESPGYGFMVLWFPGGIEICWM